VLAERSQSHAVSEARHEAHLPHLVDDCRRGGAVPPLPLPAQAMVCIAQATVRAASDDGTPTALLF
jgi:hypothetical protein